MIIALRGIIDQKITDTVLDRQINIRVDYDLVIINRFRVLRIGELDNMNISRS